MKRLFTAAIVAAAMAHPSFAAPSFKADGFADAFNAYAEKLTVSQRFSLLDCADAARNSCTYKSGRHMRAVFTNHPSSLGGILIYDGNTDAFADWIVASTLIMDLFAPTVSPNHRGDAMEALLAKMNENHQQAIVVLDGQKFAFTAVDNTIWFSAEPAK